MLGCGEARAYLMGLECLCRRQAKEGKWGVGLFGMDAT